jgi:hypothetical protein
MSSSGSRLFSVLEQNTIANMSGSRFFLHTYPIVSVLDNSNNCYAYLCTIAASSIELYLLWANVVARRSLNNTGL